MNVQRVGPLCSVPATIARLGADPAKVLAVAGLEPSALANPEGTIPYDKVGVLLQIASQQTGCPHFGLEVVCRVGLAAMGPLGEMMRHAPTLGAALQDFAREHHRNAHGSIVYLLPGEDHAHWGYAIYHHGTEGSQHIFDLTTMIGLNIMSDLVGRENLGSIELLLAHSEPADVSPYRRMMGLRPIFDSDQTAFILPRKLLDLAIPGANPAKRKQWQERIRAYRPAGDDDIVAQVRRATRVALLAGKCSGAEVCGQLGMAYRTMGRNLQARGLTFQRILDETRYEVCRQLLLHTRLGVGEVSAIIGYADKSVLTRRFSEWAGMTPSAWRAAASKPAR